MAGMTLVGEYVPSKAQWVRDQVEQFEASNGQEANTLRGGTDPIVVITSVGAKSGNLRKNPVMRVERAGIYVAIASRAAPTTSPSGTTTSSPTPRSSSRTAWSRRPTASTSSRVR